MSYEDLISRIAREIPELAGKLSAPRVVYVKSQRKTYLTFESSVLVEEKQFLELEKLLREVFPGRPLAVRVVSPGLRDSFLADIGTYRSVLTDFLKRNYQGIIGWLDQIDWSCQGNRVTLTFPDEVSLDIFGRNNITNRLAVAIREIFDAQVIVEATVAGDREARVERMRRERQESLLTVTRAEMAEKYGTEYDPQQAGSKSRQKSGEPSGREGASAGAAEEKALSGKRAGKPDPTGNGSSAEKHPGMPEIGTGIPVPEMPVRPVKGAILGRSIGDRPVEIRELNAESGLVVIQGDVFLVETKELRGGEMVLLSFAVTDYTSSILCKTFLRYRPKRGRGGSEENEKPVSEEERKAVWDKIDRIKEGINVKIRGECQWDNFSRELAVMVRDLVEMEKEEREDTSEEKRVELHMHTNMSTLDALTPVGDLINRAVKWGHSAIAVTDHGVLQSFPAAFRAAKGKIKLIPGCEGYLTEERDIVERADDRPYDGPIVVLDFESTGLNTATARIIEIGAVKLEKGTIVDSFQELVDPGEPLKAKISEVTNIHDGMLSGKPKAAEMLPKLLAFIGDCPIAAHNSEFDGALLRAELRRLGMQFDNPILDTLTYARKLYPELKSFKLKNLCRHLGVSLKNAHRAVHDATATAQCLARMFRHTAEKYPEVHTLEDLNRQIRGGAIGSSWHIILLARNRQGLVNLNKLVSISHLEYFRRQPHMPREIIRQYREGLILGSACEAGELFRAVLAGESMDRLREIASFYDYLEIQPIGNNAFLIREDYVKNEEDLRELNRVIVRLGEDLGKPVVATGDVHFLDPKDAVGRAVIQAGMDFPDADLQPPLYFKTTDEMLQEFAYLGEEKAREVVITNPRKIADLVEPMTLFPKHPKGEDTFQPFWDDAEDNIQRMTWERAIEMYGNPLPEIVEARLTKELKSIVGYGYCTLYNIAERLVSKSLEEGYLVGSRGSVGSSLVARMCGITEVNALPPHYRCENCRKGFFDVDRTRYRVGVDLPDRNCPQCGKPLKKDGFDIPFEVFLGFEGDKVPDIDLNFSGEYQNKAHHYVEELFGKDHVFRAGTISGLAEKTAYGYAMHYLEDRGIQAGNAEKMRLAGECTGVKRTTGQHPGGMVVVPQEYDICEFTAVQHPADDLESDFTTTHFDFNSMHDILVKLDCLGHDDPTMMHELEKLTGVNFQEVPLDDPGVRSLFTSPMALGVKEEEILCNTGTYGVPEFGTEFVRGMLADTMPRTMEELLRISGLSHGTDVWLGNAKDIINAGIAPLSECVCCRDDIMNYLMERGVKPKTAFSTMESVRKGKGLKPEMEQAMNEAGVPEWFMESCRKIKYMFPKGHAVAYVTMSLRVAWFKLHMPQAYYCAYFTVRGDGFDAGSMLLSADTCRERLREIRQMDKPTAKDKETATCLELILEMNMRGIRFLPVDLYRSDVSRFRMEDVNIRCPFTSLSGFPESAAQAIVAARQAGDFLSVEDLQRRTRVGTGTLDMLRTHGSLEGMSETNQISMF
ncbi:MAG: PolC-type DNA polymerase III [Clostridia bacterium]|nr:PolC-type DNA polymerase III [Clostridia bacterium]